MWATIHSLHGMNSASFICRVIPQSYVTDASTTRDIGWNDISWDRFSHKCNIYVHIYMKNLQNMSNLTNKWQFKDKALPLELQACHLDHQIHCPTVTAAAVVMPKSLKMTCRNQALKSGWQRPLLLLQNLHIAHKHPHNPLSSCCCSLLVPINVPKHLDASSSQSKPLSQLQIRHSQVPLLLQWCFASEFQQMFNC